MLSAVRPGHYFQVRAPDLVSGAWHTKCATVLLVMTTRQTGVGLRFHPHLAGRVQQVAIVIVAHCRGIGWGIRGPSFGPNDNEKPATYWPYHVDDQCPIERLL